jgi:hypothetical protein
VVDPSPEIVEVLIAACSNNFSNTFPLLDSNSRDFTNDDPLVIKLKSPFLFAIIPVLPVGPRVILTASSISLII